MHRLKAHNILIIIIFMSKAVILYMAPLSNGRHVCYHMGSLRQQDGDSSMSNRSIVLIGFMGTGKSTVGARLAEQLKLRFCDLDEEIVSRTGQSIPDIFAERGGLFPGTGGTHSLCCWKKKLLRLSQPEAGPS